MSVRGPRLSSIARIFDRGLDKQHKLDGEKEKEKAGVGEGSVRVCVCSKAPQCLENHHR